MVLCFSFAHNNFPIVGKIRHMTENCGIESPLPKKLIRLVRIFPRPSPLAVLDQIG